MGIDWNGHPPLPRSRIRLRRRLAWVLREHSNLYVTATTDGQHAPGSYHYSGRAVDLGANSSGPKKRAYENLHHKYGNHWTELFGPGSWYVKNGRRYSGQFPDHKDHIHLAL